MRGGFRQRSRSHQPLYGVWSVPERPLLVHVFVRKDLTIQTFLPWPEFDWCARVLDRTRLGNQRNETFVIMRALYEDTGYSHHPATNMWRGYERALLAYQQSICNEWSTVRGYSDTMWDKTRLLFLKHNPNPMAIPFLLPHWLGDVDFHLAHQSTLLRKNEEHYRPFFPGISLNREIFYPKGREVVRRRSSVS